jgi:hypothetical protein
MAYQQVIEGRYIDRKKLSHLLRKLFGERNFEVRVSNKLLTPCRGFTVLTLNLFLATAKLLDLDSAETFD